MTTTVSLRDLPRPVALVLSGGGSLGALQVGMLQVLAGAGVVPDHIFGTSVGALNGAVVAELGLPEASRRLEQIWRATRRRDVLSVGLSSLGKLVRRTPVFSTSGIERLVRTHLTADTFDQLGQPLVVVATDAVTGAPTAFDQGSLVAAITASAAIPGVFPAVDVAGRWYLDGGVSANLPVAEAHRRQAKSIIALDVISSPNDAAAAPDGSTRAERPVSILASALFSSSVIFRQQRRAALEAAAEEVPVVVCEAPSVGVHPLNFSNAEQLIAHGARSARATVDSLAINGPGLYGTRLGGDRSQ